jgi:uncharacterized protein (TIGR02118 family)
MVETLVVLYPPQSDPDRFRLHYEEVHVPLVLDIPGLLGFRYAFDVTALDAESPYFCVAELDFADGHALDTAFASAEGWAAVADVANFADEPITRLRLDAKAAR